MKSSTAPRWDALRAAVRKPRCITGQNVLIDGGALRGFLRPRPGTSADIILRRASEEARYIAGDTNEITGVGPVGS